MKTILTSVVVGDQEKALRFNTELLGFTNKTEISIDEFNLPTVESPEGAAGAELLEPTQVGPAKV